MKEKKKNGAGSGAENNAGAEALENSAAGLLMVEKFFELGGLM